MNRYAEFKRLLPTERRAFVTVVGVRADGTSVVQTPEGRNFRVRGVGIPVNSKAFVILRSDRQPQMDGPAPDLPLSVFDSL